MDKYARGQRVRFVTTNSDHAPAMREKLRQFLYETGTIVHSLGFDYNEWERPVRRAPKARQYRYYHVKLEKDGSLVEAVPEDALAPADY